MFQTCTLTAGGLETILMHDAYISFIHLWKFFTLAQNWRDIVFKNIDQDFLLKTTNLMTYAARDKNSLLNFLDENLVNCNLFSFAPLFSLNELFRCFWKTTWPTTTSSESLPSSGRVLHRWIIGKKTVKNLHSWCPCRPWRRQSTCALRTRSLRPTSKPSWKPSKSSVTSSMGTSHQGMKLSPG